MRTIQRTISLFCGRAIKEYNESVNVKKILDRSLFDGLRFLALLIILLPVNTLAQSDDCANATILTDVNNFCSADGAYTNVGATASGFGSATCWAGTLPNEVWFSFTAIAPAVSITITGASTAPKLTNGYAALYSGSCTATISQLACGNSTAGNPIQLYYSGLTPGVNYFIRVTSTTPNAGKFTLCINNYNPPTNPAADCNGASKLCNKSSVFISTFSGTGSIPESGGCMASENNSLWYTWTCATAGTLSFDIIPVKGTNDIDFVLFQLSGTDPCGVKTAVRCNVCSCLDGYAGPGSTGLHPSATNTTEQLDCRNLPTDGQNAYCSVFNMTAGTSYALLINNANGVDGYRLNFGGTGSFQGADPKITSDKNVICSGESITFDGSTSTGYTALNWNFSSGNGNPASGTGPGPYTVTYNTAGTFSAILNATLTGCPPATVAKSIVVKASPTAPVASSADVCSGDPLQLNATASTGAYSWTGPNSFTSTVQNPSINPSTTSNSGTYTVNATLNGCVSPNSSVTVKVGQRKSAGSDKTLAVCNSQSTVDLLASLGGTPDAGGVWTVIGTAPAGYTNTSTLNTAGVAQGTYVFQYSFTGDAPCPDVSAKLTLTINKAAVAGSDKTWSVCGNDTILDLKTQLSANAQSGGVWSKNGTFGGSLDANTGIFDTQGMVEGTYKFQYTIAASAPCVTDVADITLKTVRKPFAGQDSVYDPLCQSDGQIDILGALGPGVDATGTWSGGVVAADGTVNISSMKGSFTYTYTSTSSNTSVCPTDVAVVKFDVNDAPTFTVDPVLCNSTNDKISIKINMNGGQSSSYNLVINPMVNGTRTGNVYNSGPINPGAYTITLTDAKGCGPVATQTVSKVCNCTTDAGDMTPTTGTLQICGPGPASASQKAGTETLDGNDVLSYVLHTSPTNNLGTIFGRSASNTFSLDLAGGMQYDVVYYISAIAGNKGADNQVDLANTNFCNSVAPGRPVIWRQLPFASMVAQPDSICVGSSAELVFTLGVNGPFTVTMSDNTVIPNLTTSANKYTVTPTTIGTNTYTGSFVTDNYGCSTNFTSPVTVELLDRPVIDVSSVTTTCNSTNTGYTIQFKVQAGDKSTYNFTGTPGTFDPTTDLFTSSVIPNGTTYQFTVTDVNNCNPDQLSNSHTCPCTTQSGTMSNTSTTLEFCQSQPADATGVHNGDHFLDGNDVLNYVLTTDPNNAIAKKVDMATQPVFAFKNGYTPGTIYYICPIAGDDDGNGFVDLVNGCKKESPGTPVRWLPSPSASISTSVTEICQGTDAAMTVNVNTFNGRSVDFTVNAQSFTRVFSINAPSNFTIPDPNPTLANDTMRAWIDGGTVQYTAAPFCKGSWIPVDTQKVFVIPTPTAILVSANHILCPQETMPLNFTTTGHGSVSVSYTGGNFSVPAAQSKTVTLPPFTSSATYSISSVSSQSPAGTTCPGNGTGTVTFNVKQSPGVVASFVPPVICYGQNSDLQLSASGSTPDYTVYYHSNNVARTQVVPVSGYTIPYLAATGNVTVELDSVVDATVSSATGRGCKADLSATPAVVLTVNTLPIATISGGGPVCAGESAPINFEVTGANPFRIVYSDGVIDPASQNETRQKAPSVTTTYTLTSVRDANGCVATTMNGSPTITVNPIPVPDFITDVTSSCPPLICQIKNTTDYTDLGVSNCKWEIQGKGTIDNCLDQNVYINEPGSYDVKLTVTSGAGCVASKEVDNYLTVHPFPKAAFSYTPEESTFLDTRKLFENHSELADTSWWYFYDPFGKLMDSTDVTNPEYVFPDKDTGTYRVELRTITRYGCEDETFQRVRINGELIIYSPNAFSPNGDGVNDVFRPEMSGYNANVFELYIFDRWGERLFYTKDPKQGWDGTYRGKLLEPDVYVFRLITKSAYDAKKQEVVGRVTLVR